jgi:predicted transcriptional regulator
MLSQVQKDFTDNMKEESTIYQYEISDQMDIVIQVSSKHVKDLYSRLNEMFQ